MLPVSRPDGARSWTRLDGVDALRALAILYVLLNHVNMRLLFAHVPWRHALPPQLVTALVWQGQPGVQIFFCVSGFLITATTLRRWGTLEKTRPRDFYLLRLARIAPLLIVLLAVLSLLHAMHLSDFRVSQKLGGLPGALIAALTLRVGLFEATRGYLPANWDILWSLSVEEVFYLFFPLAARWLGRGRWLLLVLLTLIVLGPFARTVMAHGNETWQEYSYLGGMDAIAFGCLTALAIHGRRPARRTVRILLGIGFALMIFCLGFEPVMDRVGIERLGLGMTILAVGTCMVIVAAAQSRWQAPRVLSPILALGRRSYEVYLTHMFVVFGCFNFFVHLGKPVRLVGLLFVATIVLAGILGEVVGRFFQSRRIGLFGLGLGMGRNGWGRWLMRAAKWFGLGEAAKSRLLRCAAA